MEDVSKNSEFNSSRNEHYNNQQFSSNAYIGQKDKKEEEEEETTVSEEMELNAWFKNNPPDTK